ncbi:hypothetical protein ACVMGC_004777 [Bradyrhizobium barranii subsp. barranii]|uniref:hypothetical protein n=1 Tax=Bradyrhizobium liaoningense TaxID=43992 RepID=UPI001BA7AC52|nr:hypothetical protein [Bradyrhizobium liaoningense]MBR0879113.1 hypothetical protein [Bradyrhizobium liaoningense]
MFSVEIDGLVSLLGKFKIYSDNLVQLRTDVPDELMMWQREDMKRRYPNMIVNQRVDETEAATSIWPTSRRAYETGYRRYVPHLAQPRRQGPRRGPQVKSNRPILRAELLAKLWDRMDRLATGQTKWPSTSK